MSDDQARGLYQKYLVRRLDDPAGKHKNCPFFVLDIKHDPFARAALRAYIDACRAEYSELALDLERLLVSQGTELCAVCAVPLDNVTTGICIVERFGIHLTVCGSCAGNYRLVAQARSLEAGGQ